MIYLSSHENNMPKIPNYNTLQFFRNADGRYVKFLFTNIQKQ